MITFLGVVLVLLALVMLVLYPTLRKTDKVEQRQDRRSGDMVNVTTQRKSHPLLLLFSRQVSLLVLLVGLFVAVAPYLFFFAERGYNYLLVFPTGKMDAVMTQGIKWRGLAKIDPWQKYIDVKVVGEGTEEDAEELEGVMSPVPIRFIDQVTANGHVSLRFQLPEENDMFIRLAVKYRTMSVAGRMESKI